MSDHKTHEQHEHVSHVVNNKVTYVAGFRNRNGANPTISVVSEDEATRLTSDEIPESTRLDARISQEFIIPQIDDLAGLVEIFPKEKNAINFINKKIAQHCAIRITNLMKSTPKGDEKTLTFEAQDEPIDLTSYVAEPLREELDRDTRLSRLIGEYFANDPEGLAEALKKVQEGKA